MAGGEGSREAAREGLEMGVRASVESSGQTWSGVWGRGGIDGVGRGGWPLLRGGPGSDRKLGVLYQFRL